MQVISAGGNALSLKAMGIAIAAEFTCTISLYLAWARCNIHRDSIGGAIPSNKMIMMSNMAMIQHAVRSMIDWNPNPDLLREQQ
jgi:hypothetical protein